LLWPPDVIGQTIIFLPCDYYLLSSIFFFYSSPNPSGRILDVSCLPYFYTWRGPSANLECRSEMCCWRLAANTGRRTQKSPSGHHRTNSTGCVFATKARIDNQKKLVTQQYLLHMFLHYGELQPSSGPAEILSLVWDTPANFNGFRVLAALLHSI